MAEAAVSFLLTKLDDVLAETLSGLTELRADVEWVRRELRRMQCFLKDADLKRNQDSRIRNWVQEIRDAAHQLEDLIDQFTLLIDQNRHKNLIRRSAFLLNELAIRRRISKEIQDLKSKITEISESRSSYGIESIGSVGEERISYWIESLQARRRLSPNFDSVDVVGFDEDEKVLVSRLIDQETRRRSVISIVGMGGLGKTTLAMKVYKNSKIVKHFDCNVWVSVSQECRDGRRLLSDIGRKAVGISKDGVEGMDQEELEVKLYGFLKDKRYLIVLDDVWRIELWTSIMRAFPDAVNGSRVLLTTRVLDVAVAADPICSPHRLGFLSEEESWELFMKRVFPIGEVDTSGLCEGEAIGREIVRKCGGLPLAIAVLGGVLSGKAMSTVAWSGVHRSVRRHLSDDHNHCSEILALSYNDLPYHLKSCFLYFGLFPEDYEIPARRLIRLWVAEGFAWPRNGKTVEEVAEGYLEELNRRSLIQVVKWNSYGGIKTCKIHDLLRDICISEANEEKFLGVIGNTSSDPQIIARRVALHNNIDRTMPQNHLSRMARTFSCFDVCIEMPLVKSVLKDWKLLRVLDLEGNRIRRLPMAIGELVHLRYLGLRRTALEELPSSTGKLCNLQTLDLRWTSVKNIPSSIWKIQKLRHLYFDRIHYDQRPQLDDLHDIQTLSVVGVGSWTESGLSNLISLKKLSIRGASNSDGQTLPNSLERLKGLRSLGLSGETIPWVMKFSSFPQLHVVYLGGKIELPDGIEFPPNLTKLTLKWSELKQKDLAAIALLPNLRILRLWNKAYAEKHMVFSARGFPRLEVLELFCLAELEEWEVEEGAAVNLGRLAILQCHDFKSLPSGLQHLSALHELKLWDMPKQFYSRIRGEDSDKVRHIPSITISNLFL